MFGRGGKHFLCHLMMSFGGGVSRMRRMFGTFYALIVVMMRRCGWMRMM
jgi:hypothetical protein